MYLRRIDAAFEAHYATGIERDRLAPHGEPTLELVRTLELIDRFLPPPPARILDVGGGPGVYASILARRGYAVRLVDALPLHVEQAAAVASAQPEASFETRVGDARRMDEGDASYDVVLLFGPLYHLTDRDDRLRAVSETRRVLRRRGVLLGVGISRVASLLEGVRDRFLAEPAFVEIVERELRDGQHRNPEPVERPEWFTTAFFHDPDELEREVDESGLAIEACVGVEGPGWLFPGLWREPADRDVVLRAARLAERDRALRGLSAHILVAARKP